MTYHNPHPVPEEPGMFVPVEVRGWQHGYDAGLSRPPDVPPTPGTRHPGYMLAWQEGAHAGNADGRAEGWRWAFFDKDPRPDISGAESYGPLEDGEGGSGQRWPCVGEQVLQVMLREFAPGDEAEDGLTGRVLARACTDKGVPRLYLPVRRDSSEPGAEPADDPLHDAGYWHGPVCQSLDEAARQARPEVPSRVPHFGGVVRYEPAAEHHFFDLLPLDGLLADRV
ncbi:hypothetical protein AQJ46_43320 [Streptomyces canus]|uniref:Uncharacterized protein n=1 Tax=Streptomyces canus TaxID=58343 RepID=A0A124HVF5_9ACTN|nr:MULTISPECIES: hypothetical protein [Streptomyces]KUN58244.1 hypothetical protein AQJ46_43320 [Streptomyces canus]MDI5906675.1 hypothetical protein [Streptomyces sp. 12257]